MSKVWDFDRFVTQYVKESPDEPPYGSYESGGISIEKSCFDNDAYTFFLINDTFFSAKTDDYIHEDLLKLLTDYFAWSNLEEDEQTFKKYWPAFVEWMNTTGISVYPNNPNTNLKALAVAIMASEKLANPNSVGITGRIWLTPYNRTNEYIISFWNYRNRVIPQMPKIIDYIKSYKLDPELFRYEFIDDATNHDSGGAGRIEDISTLKDVTNTNKPKASEEEIKRRIETAHMADPIAKKQMGIKVPMGVGSRKMGPSLATRQQAQTSESFDSMFKRLLP